MTRKLAPLPDNINNILIVRLSAIGDVVMSSGILYPLRQAFPRARISWLTQPECVPLIENHPEVNEVIRWPRNRWRGLQQGGHYLQLIREIRSLRRELQLREFDLALDLQGLFKSGFLVWLSGADQRFGLGAREGSQWLVHKRLDRSAAGEDLIGSEYRSTLSQLNIPNKAFRMQVGINATSQRKAADTLSNCGVNRLYTVICPFTTRPQKHWRNEYWRELTGLLSSQRETVVMLGGPSDTAAAEKLVEGTNIVNLCGKTSLQEAAAIIANSHGLIGVDTGLTHMGHTFQIPTLCLFGSTRPYLDPDNPKGRVIYLNKECAPCRRHPICGGSFHCMGDISPQRVHQEYIELIGAS